MLSLAPLKYADVLSENGGPISHLEYTEGVVMGLPCMQAMAFLREGLVDPVVRARSKVEPADGAGSHRSEQIACHLAVSEALERWAIYYCRAHPDLIACGLEIDGSSNGFAAFPGLFRRQARKVAFRESIERHCLICWWEGLIGHTSLPDPIPGVRAIRLNNSFSSHAVIILWTYDQGQHAFSYGAGSSVRHATWRAYVELDRTQKILLDLKMKRRANSSLDSDDIFERRIEYFSRQQGMIRFLERLERDEPPVGVQPLKLLFDGAVRGPWEKYASVWRTVIESPNRKYLSTDTDYFFW